MSLHIYYCPARTGHLQCWCTDLEVIQAELGDTGGGIKRASRAEDEGMSVDPSTSGPGPNIYKEYYVGGPWNGQEKSVGDVHGGIRYYAPPDHPMYASGLCRLCLSGEHKPERYGMYRPRRFIVMDRMIQVWLDDEETEESARIKLADILLAPHKR